MRREGTYQLQMTVNCYCEYGARARVQDAPVQTAPVVDEAPPRCGLAVDICALAANKAFSSLIAPPQAVTAPHTPIPFARELESAYLPSKDAIEAAVRKSLNWR